MRRHIVVAVVVDDLILVLGVVLLGVHHIIGNMDILAIHEYLHVELFMHDHDRLLLHRLLLLLLVA